MLTIEKQDVWSATLDDRPGGLKEKLEGLAMAGANLDFIIARRLHNDPGHGIVFVTGLEGEKQISAARQLGFKNAESLHQLRVHGPDEPGIAYRISSAITQENINLRGVSAARQDHEFTMYLAFDTDADAQKAKQRLSRAF
jgi:hypothetical protein